MKSKKNIANFLFEASALKRIQRTGWQVLGENRESVAQHSYMVAVIAYILACKIKADITTVLTMSLFHDFSEVRTGDAHKLADLYVHVDEKKALKDAFCGIGQIGENLYNKMSEYSSINKSIESKIVHDADVIALCIELKLLIEKGNNHAKSWFENNKNRLKLKYAKKIIAEIELTDSQDWWKKQRDILHRMGS